MWDEKPRKFVSLPWRGVRRVRETIFPNNQDHNDLRKRSSSL
jgi:hypothetical protein